MDTNIDEIDTDMDFIQPDSAWGMQENLTRLFVASKKDLAKNCFVGPCGSMSYRKFDAEVRRVASAISGMGISAGQRVAVSLDDSPDLATIFFGSMAMGAVPLVINPNLDSDTLAYILQDCDARIIFGKIENSETIQRATKMFDRKPNVIFVGADILESRQGWIPASADSMWNSFRVQDVNELAFIQYTSGTTGKPKGVMHSALSVLSSCAYFAKAQLGLTGDDTLYSVPKIFFGYGMGNSLFFPLYLGATSLLDPRWPTVATVVENLKKFLPNVVFAVPTLYRMLLEEKKWPQEHIVRLLFSAGAPLSEEIRNAWRASFGFEIYEGIGTTELCHVYATSYPDAVWPGSVGRMVPGFHHKIVSETGKAVKIGDTGVLLVNGSCSSIGYWNNSSATEEKFDDGWFRTGDFFSEDEDGHLYFHGREDDCFKVFGRWLMPLEIEKLLKSRFPEINEAFVVPSRDTYGENRPVLFLQAREQDIKLLARRALVVIGDCLESFKKPVLCLPLPEIPYTANGKVNRRALSEKATAVSRQQSIESLTC